MNNAPGITLQKLLWYQAPPSGLQRRKYQRYAKSHSTYLGLIACVIQKSENKRLSFCQIMDNLEPFVSGERRGLVNNIRVCLSSNDCFVKVPVHPEYPNSKRNFWKVDETRITLKMLRRHFKGMLDTFPDLASRLNKDPDASKDVYTTHNPPSASAIQKGPVTKFSGPFSIESILKKDACSGPRPKSNMLYVLPSSLDGRNQDLKPTRTGFGMKRKSGLEDDIWTRECISELRGHVYENENAALSNCYNSYSTQEIRSLPDCHPTFRLTKIMRMCPDLPDTMLPRKVAASQFRRVLNFNVPNHLHYPFNAYNFSQ